MVSNIDATRISGPSRSHSGSAPSQAARTHPQPPASDDGDVRLSLSETARRLSGASISAGEAASSPDRPAPTRIDASPPPLRAASAGAARGEGDDDGDGIGSGSADRAAPAGLVSAYRAAPRSTVGARVSIRA